MRSLMAVCILLFCMSGVVQAEPVNENTPTLAEKVDHHVPHVTPCPVQPHPVMPPRIYPHTPSMGPGSFYYDGWGRPYRPIIRPHIVPRRRSNPPQWSPWPEYNKKPYGQGGYGKGPFFRYHYGPQGWGFRIGPNVLQE